MLILPREAVALTPCGASSASSPDTYSGQKVAVFGAIPVLAGTVKSKPRCALEACRDGRPPKLKMAAAVLKHSRTPFAYTYR